MRLFLVRHPQTLANQQKIIYGKTDYPYTLLGEKQRTCVLEYFNKCKGLNNLEIISSSARRTVHLANEIAAIFHQIPKVDHRLGEMNFGIFEGLTYEEAKEKYPKAYDDFLMRFETTRIPEGESYDMFQRRVINYIQKDIYETDLIIVTHGAVIREILEHLLKLNPGESWKFLINNGTIVELEKKKSDYVLSQLIQPIVL